MLFNGSFSRLSVRHAIANVLCEKVFYESLEIEFVLAGIKLLSKRHNCLNIIIT